MQTLEFLSIIKIRNQKPYSQFSSEGQCEEKPVTYHLCIAKVLDGNLKSNTGSKEDAHEPLKQTFELGDETHVHFMLPAKHQSGEKGSQKE
mmetsp:Transcript_4452/g.9613  ORF Transcript_4452/g.9613 Transcript_4452/m.9613 type:complete len:91 (+) Transcript_4452:1445-1717(+)